MEDLDIRDWFDIWNKLFKIQNSKFSKARQEMNLKKKFDKVQVYKNTKVKRIKYKDISVLYPLDEMLFCADIPVF